MGCPACGKAVGLNDWHREYLAPWAVGNLVFTFWNWPLLDPHFLAELGQSLGHRVVHTARKI